MGISYSPNVQPDNRSMALGLAQFGMAVSDAMQKKNEEEKQRGRLATTLRSYATQAGIIPKERADQMGLEELHGTVQSAHYQQEQQDRAAKQEELAQRLLYYKTLTEGAQQKQKANAALPAFATAYANRATAQGPMLPGSPMTDALSAAPEAAQSEQLDNLMTALQRSQGNGGQDTTPRVVPLQLPDGRSINVVHAPGSHDFKFPPSEMAAGVDEQGNAAPDQTRSLPDGTVQAYNGKTWVTVLKSKVQTLPESFNKTMDEVTADIAAANSALGDPALDAKKRSTYDRSLKTAQQRGKAVIDRYHTQKLMDDGQRDAHYAELGIAPQSPPATGGKGGKVKVTKDGKQFWLPEAQLKDAEAQGYQRMP